LSREVWRAALISKCLFTALRHLKHVQFLGAKDRLKLIVGQVSGSFLNRTVANNIGKNCRNQDAALIETWISLFLRNPRLTSAPGLRTMRRQGSGAVRSRSVLVHCPSRLGAAVTVLAMELLGGDGMFTNRTFERAKTVHSCDGVMPHSYVACGFLISDESQTNEGPVETEILSVEKGRREGQTSPSQAEH